MEDPYDLARFVVAQDRDGMYQRAVDELRQGRKRTHWIWFVFPQLVGLGRSAMAVRYAISSIEEAVAYLEHPILGTRLCACSAIVAEIEGRSAREIFGDLDAQKLRSSMTLFARAAPDNAVFADVLERYFAGLHDPSTAALLSRLPD